MTSSIFLPSTTAGVVDFLRFSLAPLSAVNLPRIAPPVTLKGAPILMVSSAAASRDENELEADRETGHHSQSRHVPSGQFHVFRFFRPL